MRGYFIISVDTKIIINNKWGFVKNKSFILYLIFVEHPC